MSEKKLWQTLSTKMKKAYPIAWHATRIETGATALGQPDVNYALRGTENHIELKYAKSEKKWCALRPSQFQWMKKRLAATEKPCWILVEVAAPARYYLLISSVHARGLIENPNCNYWAKKATASFYGDLPAECLADYLMEC